VDRRWVSRRAWGLHATIAVVVPGFLALTAWQVDRALTGNTLSWVYSFEWPFFTGYAVYLWWRLVHEDPAPRAPVSGSEDGPGAGPSAGPPGGADLGTGRGLPGDDDGPADEADEDLEAYNRYLAALNESGKRKRW
jgi:hypothetical protein